MTELTTHEASGDMSLGHPLTPRRALRHTAARLTGVIALAAGAIGLLPAVASADAVHHVYRTCSTPGGCGLYLRSGPASSAGKLALLADGDAFTVSCWTLGDDVYGDPVWLAGTANGQSGYATDYYIDTHWNSTADLTSQGIPRCGTTTPTPAPVSSTAPAAGASAAIAWARTHLGQHFDSGLCLGFVHSSWQAAGVGMYASPSAASYASLMRSRGLLHTTGTPPAGAVVLWWGDSYNADGHAALSLGDGTAISTAERSSTTVHVMSIADRSRTKPYAGWVAFGASGS